MSNKAAYDFFYKNAGFSKMPGETKEQGHRRSAKALATAEAYASAHGWRFEWEEDPEGMESIGDIDPEDISDILMVSLIDDSGRVLASLGSVAFGHNQAQNRRDVRIFEAELASEAMPRATAKRR